MSSLMTHGRVAVIAVAALMSILWPSGTTSAAGELDWWKVDRDVSKQLIGEEKNLIDWAAELSRREPATPEEAIVKIDVCLRAALDDEACDALRSLRRLEPEISSSLLEGIYYRATDNYMAWDVARVLAETFAPQVRSLPVQKLLFRHGTQRTWSDEQFVAWLDARIESVLAYDREMAKHQNSLVPRYCGMSEQLRPIDFWRRARFEQLCRMGKGLEELKRLQAAVSASPRDAEVAINYLKSLEILRWSDEEARSISLDWFATASRPAKATEQQAIASLLMRLQQPAPAEKMLRRALDTGLTDEEVTQMGMMSQASYPDATYRMIFAVRLREELAQCLLQLGKADESQAFMVAAADIRQKNNLPPNLILSGMVQGASGARVIEGRIREQEKENQDDPQYWIRRAEYYRGRGEADEEESALRNGLALCIPAPAPRGKAIVEMRQSCVIGLAWFFIRQKRQAEAAELLLTEMREAPADSASSQAAARHMAFELVKYVKPDQREFWDWLVRRKTWSHIEERLLWRLLEAAPKGSVDPFIVQAERIAMADGADVTRTATLGWILNRMKLTERSIPLLEHATANATDDDLRGKASVTLFESYVDLGDWRKAEAVFGQANERLTSTEGPQWLGRVATVAATQGQRQDALRIWRRVANCNLRNKQLVDALSRRGLRQQLRDYYADARRRLPTAKLAEVIE